MSYFFLKAFAFLYIATASFISHSQIYIGQSSGFSGIVAFSVEELNVGAHLVIDSVNQKGGVHGEKIIVHKMDDQFNPVIAGQNARVLIEEKNVLAMFLERGTPHTEAQYQWLEKYKVPMIAPSTGAMILHQPVKRFIFNVRATYQQEAAKAIELLLTLGLTRIAVSYVNDSFGEDGLAGAMIGFNAKKVKPLFVEKFERVQPNFSKIVSKAQALDAQALFIVAPGTLVAECTKQIRLAGSSAQIVTLSNNASTGFVKAMGVHARGTIVAQVFPGERNLGHPFVREAMELAKAKGLQELSPTMLEGFAAAKVLVEALKRTGPKPTREKLMKTLEEFKPFDLGGGLMVEYSPKDHTGLQYADLSIIGMDGKFRR